MVETLRSLEMEREVGARLGEGELAVLRVGNQARLSFGIFLEAQDLLSVFKNIARVRNCPDITI